jgi:hypothetical protein
MFRLMFGAAALCGFGAGALAHYAHPAWAALAVTVAVFLILLASFRWLTLLPVEFWLAALLLLAGSPALADTASDPTTAGSTALFGGIVTVVGGILFAGVRWCIQHELAKVVALIGVQMTPSNEAALEAAVTAAAGEVQTKLAQVADAELQAKLGPLLAKGEAASILRYVTGAASTLGITAAAIEGKILALIPGLKTLPPLPTQMSQTLVPLTASAPGAAA